MDEGMDVYHNPRALHPLDPEMLPGAVHHRLLDDGRVEAVADQWQPLASLTSILVMREGRATQESAEEIGDA